MMRAYGLFLLAAVLLSGLSGCGLTENKRDIRDFYFPLKKLTEGLVYEYRSVNNDSVGPSYWYYRSFITPDSVLLTGTYYESELLPLQLFKEEVVSNGMLLDEMYIFERDSTGRQHRIDVDVQAGSAFPFSVRDSGGIFLYKLSWETLLDPGARITLIKNRRYTGDTTFTFQGTAYDCVLFEVRELLEYDKEGVLEKEYSGVEFYAEGLGLVYYRKDVADGFTIEYRLVDRYPMDTLERKFLEMYHPEVLQGEAPLQ